MGPQAGDLPNIHMPGDGQLTIESFVNDIALSQTRQSLLEKDGAAIVVQAGKDDYQTNPAGGAGNRIACAVVMR
jgi:Cu-Zn family superoxide dismutase